MGDFEPVIDMIVRHIPTGKWGRVSLIENGEVSIMDIFMVGHTAPIDEFEWFDPVILEGQIEDFLLDITSTNDVLADAGIPHIGEEGMTGDYLGDRVRVLYLQRESLEAFARKVATAYRTTEGDERIPSLIELGQEAITLCNQLDNAKVEVYRD